MDAERLLRLYLEQRRELGEREFVLDDLSVEEVLRIVGARQAAPKSDSSAPARGRPIAAPPRSKEPPRSGESPAGKEPPASKAPPRERAPREDARPNDTSQRREGGSSPHGADWRAALRAADTVPAPPKTDSPLTVVRQKDETEFLQALRTAESVEAVAGIIAGCNRCPLYRTARNPVPGEGNPKAGFMCVGEAPGETEDETGRPFVGRAGQLLTKILAAINLSREEVFIANVLKHRPPGNRNPEASEVKACRPYLVRQIELVQPRVILALGTFAAQSLLESTLPLNRLRGTVHSFAGVPVVVTYHPAALLRNPQWKRPAWEDVQHARRILDSTVA